MNEECCRSEPAGAGVGRAEKNTQFRLVFDPASASAAITIDACRSAGYKIPQTVFGRSWSRLAIDLRRIVRGTSAESEL